MRPLISYDDISLPQHKPNHQPPLSQIKPPAKKRKRQNPKSAPKHWDDNSVSDVQSMNYDEVVEGDSINKLSSHGVVHYRQEEEGEYEEETCGKQLTQEDSWDDSALIDAWNAATAEYEAYHGPGKDWKKQPVHKSPLWHNPATSTYKTGTSTKQSPSEALEPELEKDSQPLNFDTFVPTHDPSLAATDPPLTSSDPELAFFKIPYSRQELVSRDEAFNRALAAMYWGGYWTAMYHCQAYVSEHPDGSTAEAYTSENDEENSLSTQHQ